MENEFKVTRSSRRKRIALRIAPDGVLEVLAPQNCTLSVIRRIIAANGEVIARLRAKTPRRVHPFFQENTTFPLLGKYYPLHLTGRLHLFDQKFMIPRGTQEDMRKSMTALYRELAKNIIHERIQLFIPLMKVSPSQIKISSAEQRWGSCSAKKTISFSWKLIQCPLPCVDYVIVHELAHLTELNHSPAFWKTVEKVLPDYRDRKRQLNEFSAQLPLWE